MGKVEANKQQKRESILNAAFRLFTQKGITKTSISDIVKESGVAKGTFYLYFKDKYDVKNLLIAHKASELFYEADKALKEKGITDIIDAIIFITEYMIDALTNDKTLLLFISKNLSWGVFKTSLINSNEKINFYNLYSELIEQEQYDFIDPEIMLFMIIEMTSSSCYSSILYNEPVPIEKLKPYIIKEVKNIINEHLV